MEYEHDHYWQRRTRPGRVTAGTRIDLADEGWDRHPPLWIRVVILLRARRRRRRAERWE